MWQYSQRCGYAGLHGGATVGYFDFSNDDDFSGKAHSTGWAGKLGMTYKVNKQMTIGATYHSETSLGDLEGVVPDANDWQCWINGLVSEQPIL